MEETESIAVITQDIKNGELTGGQKEPCILAFRGSIQVALQELGFRVTETQIKTGFLTLGS